MTRDHGGPGVAEVGPERTGRTRSRVTVFVASTFVLSWMPWLVLVTTTRDPFAGPTSIVLYHLGGLGPTLAGFVAAGADGRRGLRRLACGLGRWRIGRWYLALLLPLPIATIAIGYAVVVGPVDWEIAGLTHWLLLPVPLLLGVLIGGLEEIGWRGYLLPVAQDRVNALTASVAIGLLWSLWHAPLFLMLSISQADLPPGWFLLQGVALSIVFTWVYNGTGGSVLAAVLIHGAVNGWNTYAIGGLAPDAATTFLGPSALLFSLVAVWVIVRHGPASLAARPRHTWARYGAPSPSSHQGDP